MIEKYVIFSVIDNLEYSELIEFYKCLQDRIGEENLARHNKHKIVHFVTGNLHYYVVPLKIHITDTMSKKIAGILLNKFSKKYNTFENSISDEHMLELVNQENNECSVTGNTCCDTTTNKKHPETKFKDDMETHRVMIEEFGKYIHKKWLENRINKGWRYGTKIDEKGKMHPLILPWEQLPEEYKEKPEDLPSIFSEMLKRSGYDITKKNE